MAVQLLNEETPCWRLCLFRGGIMTWFSLPETQTVNQAAFHNAASASDWLASQPQANVTAMLDALIAELSAFNTFTVTARERFKVLEVLRKAVFAVSGECQRRFDGKPLPLSSGEQALFDQTRALWCVCCQGYLHCVRACLERDEKVLSDADKVVHRAMTCLRMEQWCCYLAGTDGDAGFWRDLHAVYASAEALGVLAESIEDRLPRETVASTINGQYGMALLLHLANPFALTRAQFAVAARWLARWRELAIIQPQPETRARSCCVALDLVAPTALHDNSKIAEQPRWLVLDAVLRKMRKRSELLAAGESPESLKLGNTLSAEACATLLETLSDHLRMPASPLSHRSGDEGEAEVVWGIENIYRQLGGRNLAEPSPTTTYVGRVRTDQLAVFGHVVDTGRDEKIPSETWQIDRHAGGTIDLRRQVEADGTRMALHNILILRTEATAPWLLASTSCLSANGNEVSLTVALEAGDLQAVIAAQWDGMAGKTVRSPGILHAGSGGEQRVMLPPGLNPQARALRLLEAQSETQLPESPNRLVERGGDHECWSLTSPDEAA